MLFEWLASKVREAFARGAAQGLADIGVVAEGATAEQVRQAIADKPAADRKDRPRGGGK
jgi:hypothetical protein